MKDLGAQLRDRLRLAAPGPVPFARGGAGAGDGYVRERIEHRGLEGGVLMRNGLAAWIDTRDAGRFEAMVAWTVARTAAP